MNREQSWLAFALVYPTFLAWGYFVLLDRQGTDPNPLQQAAYGVGKTLQFLYPLLFCWWFDGKLPRPSRPRFEGLLPGLAFGLLTALAMFALYFGWLKHTSLFASTPQRVGVKLQQFGLNSTAGFFGIAIFVATLHALLEEYYWRWFAFGRLRQHRSFPMACVLSSVGFMAHHVIVLAVYLPGAFWKAAVPLSLCIAVGGAMWAWLFERTKTVYSAWLSHALIDLAVFVVAYDILRELFS